jgi:hypothetical protein
MLQQEETSVVLDEDGHIHKQVKQMLDDLRMPTLHLQTCSPEYCAEQRPKRLGFAAHLDTTQPLAGSDTSSIQQSMLCAGTDTTAPSE